MTNERRERANPQYIRNCRDCGASIINQRSFRTGNIFACDVADDGTFSRRDWHSQTCGRSNPPSATQNAAQIAGNQPQNAVKVPAFATVPPSIIQARNAQRPDMSGMPLCNGCNLPFSPIKPGETVCSTICATYVKANTVKALNGVDDDAVEQLISDNRDALVNGLNSLFAKSPDSYDQSVIVKRGMPDDKPNNVNAATPQSAKTPSSKPKDVSGNKGHYQCQSCNGADIRIITGKPQICTRCNRMMKFISVIP